MRRSSTLVTILITSFVMVLSGLVASPNATASENKTVRVSAKFSFGSSVLTKSQKAEIKKALASSGSDAPFIATGVAGKLPGVSNRQVKSLAKKRAQAIKAYLLSLGVSNTSVTTEAKVTKIGVDPSSVSYPTPVLTVIATNSTGTVSGSGGGGTAITISVAAIAGVTAPVTGATPVTTTTAGTGYTGTVVWSGSPATFASATTYTATITLTPTSGYTFVGITANFFTVAGANSDTNSADSGVITAVFPATVIPCASGGPCIVGATGPGGGIVYYEDLAGFSCGANYTTTGSPTGGLCKYLEVAPSGWSGGGTDPTKLWAVTANTNIDVSGLSYDGVSPLNSRSGIGLGLKNSIAIYDQGNDTTTAAGAARAYAGGSKHDWYLPTTAELNLLAQWNHNVTQNVASVCTGVTYNTGTGSGSGFEANRYWSSSIADRDNAFYQNFYNCASQNSRTKDNADYVRPIRAF